MSQIDDIVNRLQGHAMQIPWSPSPAPLAKHVSTTDRLEYADTPSAYSTSSPLPLGYDTRFPSALKSVDVNKKKGIVTAYLTVFCRDDGSPFIDPYNDIIAPGSFTKTIQKLDAFRKSTNNPWLCPSLWQHNKDELIGGIARLSEDSRGVIYESHLAMGVRRAQEALELAEQKMIGSSYGYDPLHFTIQPGNVRRLTEIGLREQSYVSFPANPLGQILDVKDNRFTSYPSYPKNVNTQFLSQVQNYSRSPGMQEKSTSELATEMLSLFGKSNRPYAQQRKANYTYTVPNSNASITLNVDGTITINNVDHIDTDVGVSLASMLYSLDALDDYSEPSDDNSLNTGAAMYGEEADRRRLAAKDREWLAKKRLDYRPWSDHR